MFNRPPKSGTSIQFFYLSVATHCVAVICLFAIRFNERETLPLRHTQVSLISPVMQAPLKSTAVRDLPKRFELRARVKLPVPIQPPLPQLISPPALGPSAAPAIALEIPPVTAPSVVAPNLVFAGVGTAAKTLPLRTVAVQTGDFSATSTTSVRSVNAAPIVAAGFADVGPAPLSGARRGAAAGTEFGDAGFARSAGSASGGVRAGGFGGVLSVASVATVRRNLPSQPISAQILEKPRPAYTEEARRLRIEGEVQLEVLFRATGEVNILRVIRGLGHGLDENAAQATRTIRFLPAKKDGQPIDSTATVHIIFQLAS